jgi:hypothetical protein
VIRRALDRGYLLGLVAFVAFAWAASPYIVGNDNTEFATLGVTGGIAHPPGYPVYVMWLRAMSWLPGSTPAYTAALANAILAAASVVVLHAASRAWGARPAAATIAAAVFATSPLLLRVNTEAEAFALNDLVVAAVLWLAAAAGPLRGAWRAGVLALVAGIGLCNHMTCALVAPVGLLGVVRGVRESRAAFAIPAAIGGLIVGLVPYLYLFVASDNITSWAHPHNVGELLDIVLRKQYGGAFGFSGDNREVDIAGQLAELAITLARAWQWILLPFGLVMLGYRVLRPSGEPRAGWWALAASFLLAGPILATRFDIQPLGMGLYVLHRFHVLPALLLAIPVASALDRLGGFLVDRLGGRAPRPVIVGGLATVGFVALVITSLPELARFHSPAMENSIRGFMLGLPKDAVVFTTTDEFDVGIHYLQLTRGERTDVIAFRTKAVGARWYRSRLPFDLAPEMTEVEIAEIVLATGRPLLVNRLQKEIVASFPSYAFGPFVRILPRGAKLPSLGEVVAMNRALFEAYDLDYPVPSVDDEFAMVAHWRYAGMWRRLGNALASAGQSDAANECYAIAAQLAPRE